MKKIIDNYYFRLRKIRIENLEALTYREIVSFLLENFFAFQRGLLRFRKIVFVGRKVRVRGKSHLFLGKNIKIRNSVLLECFSNQGITLNNGVTIDEYATLKCKGSIRSQGEGIIIGMNTSIGLRNFLHGGGGIRIGKDCLLGPDVRIFSLNHNFGDTVRLIRLQGESRSEIIIEDNVWVGAGTTILPGVRIGSGSIIGAGSVVTNNVGMNSVMAGVPARLIKSRL